MDKTCLPNQAREMYARGMSLSEIYKSLGAEISISTLRRRLLGEGLLRSHGEAVRLAAKQGKLGHPGIKRAPFSDIHRSRISSARLLFSEKNAKTLSHKASGYVVFTRGPHKGRGLHRVLMEEKVGRELTFNECVHHNNEVKHDNSESNLEVMSRSSHSRHHALSRLKLMKRGDSGKWLKA